MGYVRECVFGVWSGLEVGHVQRTRRQVFTGCFTLPDGTRSLSLCSVSNVLKTDYKLCIKTCATTK